MEKNRLLTILVLAFLGAFVWGLVSYYHSTEPKVVAINTEGQPSIGNINASVKVVVFEEPKCPGCRRFNNSAFPVLHKEFIETNKIQYTVLPISFLPDSMNAAVALYCVYNQDPKQPNADIYMAFFNYIYQHQPPEILNWATVDNLMDMAKKASPAIDVDKLKVCINNEKYRKQVAENTQYAAELSGGRLSAPAVFVNGKKWNGVGIADLKATINTELK